MNKTMKELPIIFSTPMVQAILSGRKTQTRRVVKLPDGLQPAAFDMTSDDVVIEFITSEQFQEQEEHNVPSGFYAWINGSDVEGAELIKCRYGQPGDLLWVREAWGYNGSCFMDSWPVFYKADDYPAGSKPCKWRPSIHMPKDAARIWLKVVNVRVERLMVISEEDAIAEGIQSTNGVPVDLRLSHYVDYLNPKNCYTSAVNSFCSLWESIHGEGSAKQNPWVWVIEFEVVSKTGRP